LICIYKKRGAEIFRQIRPSLSCECPSKVSRNLVQSLAIRKLIADDADVIAYVNCELQKMANWFRTNKMCLNASKTKYIIFRTQNKPVDPNICNVVYNTNELGLPEDPALITPIEPIFKESQERSFKLLGVHFDEHLSFKHHIDILCTKLSKSMYCLNRVKNFVDKPSLLKLYYSMIHSNISYGINIYGCANSSNLEKIRQKQKQAIRIVCNAPYRARILRLYSKS
jgi:hypothetical protein